jgi:hypothetical protein
MLQHAAGRVCHTARYLTAHQLALPFTGCTHVPQVRLTQMCLPCHVLLQNSDDDLGSKDPKDIAVVGRWYGRMG